MSGAPRLFCLDTVLVDVVLRVAALPERAGDVLAHEQLITTGGGFNAMSAAARQGLDVVYAGRLGVGPFASRAERSLNDEHVATPVARNESLDTGICVVLVEPDGERSFVSSRGAEDTLRASDLDALDVCAGDTVLVSGYNVMYGELAELVIAWLVQLPAEITVAFDPATRMEDIPAVNLETVLARTDWLICNAREGATLAKNADVFESASSLATMSDRLNVLIRTGADGCVVATNHRVATSVDGFATEVVDLNGAGDVHNGVFLAELAKGESPYDAARWANAAAAIAVSRFGPASGPTREEVAAFVDRREGRSA
jgi:sugar/nucleoside kinase (ribokinase family)